jgi:hypothetical protein
MFFATAVEASHFHTESLPDSPLSKPISKKTGGTCLICNALHAPALSTSVAVFGVAVALSAQAVPACPHRAVRSSAFDLYVRPPPTLA